MHTGTWGFSEAAHRPASTTQQAVEGIKKFIQDNALKPGDTLPTESELCAELGFSRSSVREAIRILTTLDIVEVRHGTGTFVSGTSLKALVQGLIFRATLDADDNLETLRNVVEIRQAIDLAIGQEITTKPDPSKLDQLSAIVEKMSAKREQGLNFAEEDREFHQVLLSEIDNPIIRELNDAFWQVHMNVIPLRKLEEPQDFSRTVRAHQDIVDALQDNDLKKYQASVLRHYEPLLTSL
ncbi:GntR family transcriptional regulator [Corynebacterium minutissimum]|uniref:GntR family transcriptional regulator n=1 Tax=Corynebacterium minutissimum TaxID=38301 RepID=A0ACC4U890_9CORY|nr:FadR/GntR family transcriptional regulator [Corynebacterium sp. Marseille-Q2823]KKO77485.1 GntR family transcriptional regulator [Corynebacterium minutissimum]